MGVARKEEGVGHVSQLSKEPRASLACLDWFRFVLYVQIVQIHQRLTVMRMQWHVFLASARVVR